MAKDYGIYIYAEVPKYSIDAFDTLAQAAYDDEEAEQIPAAIERFKHLHNQTLLSWTKPKYLSPEQRYEIRMTMKIIRMELKRLREKMTVDPS